LPRLRMARGWIVCLAAVVALLAVGATGIGAAPVTVQTSVLSTISLSEPAAINPAPAPSAGTTWTPGNPDVLNFDELGPGTTGEASLTWQVTTTSPTGYQVLVANASGVAPLMKSGANSIDDMPGVPADRATLMTDSQFGMSAGDRVAHNQASVDFAGTPWGANGTTQGELYGSIPVGGAKVAERTSGPHTNDPFTLNFLAIHANGDSPAAGAYTGTIQITASTI
jgi:hypothetical protein